jgi:5-methylcytosine-specific restriction endonuclease McrA
MQFCLLVGCEKKIENTRSNKRFCSKKCNDKFHAARREKRSRFCRQCSKKFKCNGGPFLYCSQNCKNDYSASYGRSRIYLSNCLTCSKVTVSRHQKKKFCSPFCHYKAIDLKIGAYENRTAKAKRHILERRAGGLSRYAMTKLLKEWQVNQVICAYCDKFADTIDHIKPLKFGGTNHLDNLNPACRNCNASKGSKNIQEWLNARASA